MKDQKNEPERRLVSLRGPNGMTFSVLASKGADGKWSMKHPGMSGLKMACSRHVDEEDGKPQSGG